MAEFTVGENQYRSSRLSAFQQFHVARKLGPVLIKLAPNAEGTTPNLGNLVIPAVTFLAEVPEADCDYVLHRCLSVVMRKAGTGWQAVWNDQAKRLMFEDIDLSSMVQICVAVLGDNLGNFLHAPDSIIQPPSSPGSTIPPMGS